MKKSSNDHRRIKLQNIINNLPIKNHLSESQKSLIELSLTWDKWVQKNLPRDIQTLVTLNSFNNGILSIRSDNSSAASQLKHLQVSLLNAFDNTHPKQVVSIKFEINKQSTSPSTDKPFSTGARNQHIHEEKRESLSIQALKTLEHCEKGVKNEKLSASLKKLRDTLGKT